MAWVGGRPGTSKLHRRLTTPHKLQGEGALGKPSRARLAVCGSRKLMAVPWQLHAVVRPQLAT
jgi:hypothetical protein